MKITSPSHTKQTPSLPVELALNAHGGLDRWRQVRSLHVKRSLTGGLHRIKGYLDGLPNIAMRIDARQPVASLFARIQ